MVERASRRRRIRRGAVAAAFLVLAGVSAAIAVSRHQAAKARNQARAEALRAEASRLVALAQMRLADDPTEALAYATASLELADTDEARVFVMKALWQAPPSLTLPVGPPAQTEVSFSPDGTKLAATGRDPVQFLWNESGARRRPSRVARSAAGTRRMVGRRPPRDRGVLRRPRRRTSGPLRGTGCERSSSARRPGGKSGRSTSSPRRKMAPRGTVRCCCDPGGSGTARRRPSAAFRGTSSIPPAAPSCRTGRDWPTPVGMRFSCVLWPRARSERNGSSGVTAPRSTCSGRADRVWDRLVSRDKTGETRVWKLAPDRLDLDRVIPRPAGAPSSVFAYGQLRWVLGHVWNDNRAGLWDLEALAGSRPLELRRSGSWFMGFFDLHPRGDWVSLIQYGEGRASFWPLRKRYPSVVDGYRQNARPIAFSPDGRWLATSWGDSSSGSGPCPATADASRGCWSFPRRCARGRSSSTRVAGTCSPSATSNDVWVVPLDGAAARRLRVDSPAARRCGLAERTAGRDGLERLPGPKTLRVQDLETGETREFPLPTELASSTDTDEVVEGSVGEYRLPRRDDRLHLRLGRAAPVGPGERDERAGGRGRLRRRVPGPRPPARADGRADARTRGEELPAAADARSRLRDDEGRRPSWGVRRAGRRRRRRHRGRARSGRCPRGTPLRRRLPPSRGARGSRGPSGRLARRALGRDDRRGQHAAPLADAGPLEAPAAHAAPRRAAGQAPCPSPTCASSGPPSPRPGWKIEIGPFPGWKDVPTW